MKLIQLFLVFFAMVFAASTANAQSAISAISEWEGNAMGAFERNWNALLEMEYEADEGGALLQTYDYASVRGCNYTCAVHITLMPGAVQFIGTLYPGMPYERDIYQGTGDALYTLTYDPPCDVSNREYLYPDAGIEIRDYKYDENYNDGLYYSTPRRCTYNGWVELNLEP